MATFPFCYFSQAQQQPEKGKEETGIFIRFLALVVQVSTRGFSTG
jgi:hypothetical protein